VKNQNKTDLIEKEEFHTVEIQRCEKKLCQKKKNRCENKKQRISQTSGMEREWGWIPWTENILVHSQIIVGIQSIQ
jgi:hypothetical protein